MPKAKGQEVFVEIKPAISLVWHHKELYQLMMTSQGLRKPRL